MTLPASFKSHRRDNTQALLPPTDRDGDSGANPWTTLVSADRRDGGTDTQAPPVPAGRDGDADRDGDAGGDGDKVDWHRFQPGAYGRGVSLWGNVWVWVISCCLNRHYHADVDVYRPSREAPAARWGYAYAITGIYIHTAIRLCDYGNLHPYGDTPMRTTIHTPTAK